MLATIWKGISLNNCSLPNSKSLTTVAKPVVQAAIAAFPLFSSKLIGNERQIEPGLRTRDGHVVEPLLFLIALHCGPVLGVFIVTDVENPFLFKVILVHSIGGYCAIATVEKDDRRLEAFAPVDGHDLNGGTVALQALDVAVFAGGKARFLDVRGERRDQIRQIAAGGAGFFEQNLKDVQIICQSSFIPSRNNSRRMTPLSSSIRVKSFSKRRFPASSFQSRSRVIERVRVG